VTAARNLHEAPATAGAAARKPAVIYTRISKDRQGLELGNDRQEREARDLCAQRGFDVVAVYRDVDTSAYKRNVRRPGFDSTLAAIAAGEAVVVVVYHPDRFVRRNDQLEGVIARLEAALAEGKAGDFELASVTGGGYDLSTPAGRMMARVVGATAQYEMEQKGMRQKSKNVELAADGYWRGGPAPYGYRNGRMALEGGKADASAGTLVVQPDEAVEVAWMVDRILGEGWSLNRIVLDLNARGVKTVRGIAWTRQTLRRLMRTGAIAGRVTTKAGADLGKGNWTAIVPHDQWLRVQAILDDPRRAHRRPGPTREYLLTGLVHAATYDADGTIVGTDRVLMAHAREGGRRTYATVGNAFVKGAQSITVDAAGLEAFVVDVVLGVADERTILDTGGDAASNALIARRLEALDEDEAELTAGYKAGDIRMKQYRDLSADLAAKRHDLERSLTVRASVDRELERFLTTPGALSKAWPRLTFEQRRRILRRIPVRIDVGPVREVRRTFDPARVLITIP